MSEQFDPYHKWLGISPKDQPPNHYRLLGIDLFEAEPDVIAHAADQRMAHVRSFQAGKNSDLSQELLNEISAAKICLLNSAKKLAYDEQLRKTVKASLRVAGPPEVTPVQSSPFSETVPKVFSFDPTPTLHKKNVKKNPKQNPLALAAVVVGVLLLAGIVALSMSRSNGTPESKREAASKPTDSLKPPPQSKSEAQAKPKVEPQLKPEPVKPKRALREEPKVDPKPESQPESKPEPQAEPQPQPEAKSKDKLPAPDPAAQQKSLATIRDIYKGEDPVALAKKLIEKAKETQDATDRFVLLQEAKDVASTTWQGELAFDAIDQMASKYDISGLEMKAEVIEKAAKKTRITQEQKTAVANAALKVMDEAVGEDNFEVAKKLGRQAIQLVRLSKNKDLLQDIVARNKELDAAAKMYAAALEAMASLKEKPDDPDANLTVGKYLCFTKGDWEKGLPTLALGSDPTLKILAKQELDGVTSSNEQMKVGESWWNLAEKQEGTAKKQMQRRAGYWYQKALPGLSGLVRAKVEKRLKEALSADNADILLSAKTATIHGQKLSYAQDENGPGCLIAWSDAQDWVSWKCLGSA